MTLSPTNTDQYLLLRGLNGLTRKDKDPFRQDLFCKYRQCNKLSNIIYTTANSLYSLRVLATIAYYLLVHNSLTMNSGKKYVAILGQPNESSTFNDIILNKKSVSLIHRSLLGLFLPANLLASPARFKKLIHIFKLMLKKHELYVVLRAAEYLATYSKLSTLFKNKDIDGVLSFSDSNPHGLALLFIAQRYHLARFLVAHGEPHPPLCRINATGAFLLGEESRKKYQLAGAHFEHIFLKGHQQAFRPYHRLPDNKRLTLGLFLGKMSTVKNLRPLLAAVSTQLNVATVLIRRHPNMLFNYRSNLKNKLPSGLKLAASNSLQEDLQNCDIILVGNSTVQLEALLIGKPALFCAELEEKYIDVYGYIADGLALQWRPSLTLKEINDFFAAIERSKISDRLDLNRSYERSITDFNHHVFKK